MRLLKIVLSVAALGAAVAAQAQTVTVSAAASLTDAFKTLAPQFEAAHPGVSLRFNFAASGVLLQQIAQGAPVDVFASADQTTMDKAVQDKLVDPATRADFAANSVVMIVPAEGGLPLNTLKDLEQPDVRRIAVGKPDTVPVGRYTQQVLESAGLWTTLQPKFVQANNVRQALDYVARGEVEAGFVYGTDAASMKDKVRVTLTATGHTPVTYPVARTTDSTQPELAQQFIAFLTGADARAVLAQYGFQAP